MGPFVIIKADINYVSVFFPVAHFYFECFFCWVCSFPPSLWCFSSSQRPRSCILGQLALRDLHLHMHPTTDLFCKGIISHNEWDTSWQAAKGGPPYSHVIECSTHLTCNWCQTILQGLQTASMSHEHHSPCAPSTFSLQFNMQDQ